MEYPHSLNRGKGNYQVITGKWGGVGEIQEAGGMKVRSSHAAGSGAGEKKFSE